MSNDVVTYRAPSAAEEPAAETPSQAEPNAPGAATVETRRRWLLPALAALLVFTTALALTFALLWQRSAETEPGDVRNFLLSELPSVESRARELVTLLMNYDSTNIDERPNEIRPLATGRFLEQYNELVGQGLGELLEEAAASSRGDIITGPDVSFRSPTEAIAITRVSQTTQSNENPGGQSFLYVLKLTLIKTSEGWLADEVEILSEETS